MNSNFWGILHDGEITNIKSNDNNEIEVCVEIEYLRKMFPGDGECFRIILTGCKEIKFNPWEEDDIVDISMIAERRPEILYVQSTDPLVVDCSNGTLTMRYESAIVKLDNGTVVSYLDLVGGADKYWKEWENNAKSQINKKKS